jgi:hypothetical protein
MGFEFFTVFANSQTQVDAIVLRNPSHCKLREMTGNSREACRKSPRAERFSALNCRIHSRIGTMDSEQAVIYQPPEEFREILTKQVRLDVEFV